MNASIIGVAKLKNSSPSHFYVCFDYLFRLGTFFNGLEKGMDDEIF